MSSFRDDAPPWSFFIPVTLAVIVGVLAADAIRYAIGTVFGVDDTPRQVEAAPDDPPAVPERVDPDPEPAPRADASTGSDADAAAPAAPAPVAASQDEQEQPAAGGPSRTGGVLELPDSMTARRDGDPAACVNGTVVNRVAGGWDQALENDAPVPCVIVNR